ncbi:DUF945 family protein [Aidingimonas lacisalsi]|uniref:DUF945 family protein n=1 Tax=Aidingimonas lacisalsi TaxID=2604086 RepID=UPI0011D27B3E|nr:DUF945 family protein [Aidingimonas lacisalsi]
MRKGWLIVIVLMLAGGGYLGAQAWSSMLFERELTRTLDDLENDDNLRVEREDIQRGWFVSRGRVKLLSAQGEEWQVTIPYTARHGIVNTHAEGDLDIALGEAQERLFGDHLPVAPPRWNASYASFSGEFDAQLTLASFTMEDDDAGWKLETQGAEWDISGRRDDITMVGEVSPWTLNARRGELESGVLAFDSHYRVDSESGNVEQQDDVRLASLAYSGPLMPDIAIERWRYQGDMQMDDDQLRYAVSLSLDDASMGDQSLVGGGVKMTLSRLDADAAREVSMLIRDSLEQGDRWDASQRREFLQRLEPDVHAMLADSPRLTLDTVDLKSAMLDMLVDIEGELVFDGEDVETLSLDDWSSSEGVAAWRARLDGHVIWRDVPTLLLFQLGLPGDSDDLNLEIDSGEISLNGRSVAW